jgi:hypothetical protein
MDIENNLEMSGYSLMGGVPSLPSPGTHNKKGWHKAMLARDDFHPEDDDEYLKKIPEWTRGEIAITGLASGSGELWTIFGFVILLRYENHTCAHSPLFNMFKSIIFKY